MRIHSEVIPSERLTGIYTGQPGRVERAGSRGRGIFIFPDSHIYSCKQKALMGLTNVISECVFQGVMGVSILSISQNLDFEG